MARRKKKSAVLAKAQERLEGLKAVDSKADLGNGVTLVAFSKEVDKLEQQIKDYNTLLLKADDAANAIIAAEKELSISAENVLIGTKMKYGKDSSQYEMVGGVRQSERRRRSKATVAAPAENAGMALA